MDAVFGNGSVLWGAVALFGLATGSVAYGASWLRLTRPERAGWWASPWTGLGAFVFLTATSGPLVMWTQRGMSLGLGTFFLRLLVLVLIVLLYAPLLKYHAGELLGKMLAGSQPGPEPTDPLQRAIAAEESGNVRGAIERYLTLLEGEPAHVEARTRLAELLARTGRIERAKELVGRGLALGTLSPIEKAGLEALLDGWKKGRFVEPPPGGGG